MPRERQAQIKAYQFSNLTGGMNTALPPNLIGENDAQLLQNYEFDKGRLRTRGGLSAPIVTLANDTIEYFFYDRTTKYIFLFGDLNNGKRKIYICNFTDLTTPLYLGETTGEYRPCYCKFGYDVLIATGGKLQQVVYGADGETVATLNEIESSFLSDQCFQRDGRLATTIRGDDILHYSSVGDCTSSEAWTEDTNMISQAQWFEVGYKDDGDIVGIFPIASDLAGLKSNGRAYQISGQCPDLTIPPIDVETNVENWRDSIKQVGSELMFVTKQGLKTLTTTATYGNFEALETAYKINKSISQSVDRPTIWNIIPKRQAIIRPDINDKKLLYVYQYDIGAAYTFKFDVDINDIDYVDDYCIVAVGNTLRKWSYDYGDDDGTPIESKIISRQFVTPYKFITKYFDTYFEPVNQDDESEVKISIVNRNFKMKLNDKRRIKHFYTDTRGFEVVIEANAPHYINNLVLYLTEV